MNPQLNLLDLSPIWDSLAGPYGAVLVDHFALSKADIEHTLESAVNMLASRDIVLERSAQALFVQPVDGEFAMLIEIKVNVTPAEAARMSLDLATALVRENLDRDRLSVTFIGTRMQPAAEQNPARPEAHDMSDAPDASRFNQAVQRARARAALSWKAATIENFDHEQLYIRGFIDAALQAKGLAERPQAS